MSNEKINMNDPLFLVSRSLDGDLSQPERAELELLLAGSAGFRADAERLRAVAQLIKDRGENKIEIDWDSQKKLVLAEIGEPESSQADLDIALKKWAARPPQYDSSALLAGIMAQIAPDRARKSDAWRIVTRIGVPLAAAAAIALAVMTSMYAPVKPQSPVVMANPRVVVEIGPNNSGNLEKPISVVMFAKPVERTAAVVEEKLTLGYMTLGSSPLVQIEESPL